MTERVQKILSQWGIASRRQGEKMILSGRVQVNGTVAYLGQKADPDHDLIEVDGKVIHRTSRPQSIYLLLNKPVGVVSTCKDTGGRPTVLDLLPPKLRQGKGIHPVGRLDFHSTGALLLTNDGGLTLALTHPRYHLRKTYQVWVKGNVSPSILTAWGEGIILEGKKTLPAEVKILQKRGAETLLEIVLIEGRNRQIRKVASAFSLTVVSLHRIAIGEITLDLPNQPLLPGKYRCLEDFELEYLIALKINFSRKYKWA